MTLCDVMTNRKRKLAYNRECDENGRRKSEKESMGGKEKVAYAIGKCEGVV